MALNHINILGPPTDKPISFSTNRVLKNCSRIENPRLPHVYYESIIFIEVCRKYDITSYQLILYNVLYVFNGYL